MSDATPRPPVSLPLALAVCALEQVAGALHLLPAGEFRAVDGRPEKLKAWRLDAAAAARLIDGAAQRATDFVIDYEHQTLRTGDNGQPAPAAGWFRALEWREGSGLWATDVRWTGRARAMIEAGEYRYLSPVFSFDPASGAIRELLHAALTNTPALDSLHEVALKAARLQPQPETEMDPKLLEALGLPKEADAAAVVAAVAALKKPAEEAAAALKEARGELATLKRQKEGAEAELAALKAGQGDKPDPARYVPIAALTALQAEMAALKADQARARVEGLVGDGLRSGKLLPAMEPWARELGAKDPAALAAFLDAAAPIAALSSTQTGGKAPDGTPGGLGETERAVCRALGLTPEEFIKHRPTTKEG